MISDEISFDITNPKYRQFKSADCILEYTLIGTEIIVDWVCGNDAASMIKSILDVDGQGITRISGYATDKLGRASDATLQRLADRVASQLDGGWKASIKEIVGRRYVVFTK